MRGPHIPAGVNLGMLVARDCPSYLFWVRCLPCAVCGNTEGTQAHHEVGSKARGMAYKANDGRAMPLCPEHHTALHTLGHETWEHYYGPQAMHITRTQDLAMFNGWRIRDCDREGVSGGH